MSDKPALSGQWGAKGRPPRLPPLREGDWQAILEALHSQLGGLDHDQHQARLALIAKVQARLRS